MEFIAEVHQRNKSSVVPARMLVALLERRSKCELLVKVVFSPGLGASAEPEISNL